MEYTILIVLLPLLTFLVLGLLGMKLKACASGLVGTLSMAVTTALAYGTAWQYFTTAKVDGSLPEMGAVQHRVAAFHR